MLTGGLIIKLRNYHPTIGKVALTHIEYGASSPESEPRQREAVS